MTKTFKVEAKGKQSWVVIRQMPHDPQYKVGSRIPGYGKVVEVKASASSFCVGDRVTAVAYKDCFGKEHSEIRGLLVQSIKYVPEAHGVAAYDRLDCELADLGNALANRHIMPEVIRVEAASRFFAHEYSVASELDADEYDAEYRGRTASEYGNDEIRWPDGLQHY